MRPGRAALVYTARRARGQSSKPRGPLARRPLPGAGALTCTKAASAKNAAMSQLQARHRTGAQRPAAGAMGSDSSGRGLALGGASGTERGVGDELDGAPGAWLGVGAGTGRGDGLEAWLGLGSALGWGGAWRRSGRPARVRAPAEPLASPGT